MCIRINASGKNKDKSSIRRSHSCSFKVWFVIIFMFELCKSYCVNGSNFGIKYVAPLDLLIYNEYL